MIAPGIPDIDPISASSNAEVAAAAEAVRMDWIVAGRGEDLESPSEEVNREFIAEISRRLEEARLAAVAC
jgi:hypothetical protein